MIRIVRRGEIYYVDWSPERGARPPVVSPVLVIQGDLGNHFGSTTIVAAISITRQAPFPFQVGISALESGLSSDGIVKCEQIQTIDQARLGELVGSLSIDKMRQIDAALHLSLGLET
jgi:mRNA interferase MazF